MEKVYAVYNSGPEAVQAVNALEAKGYKADDITVLAQSSKTLTSMTMNGNEKVETVTPNDNQSFLDKVLRFFANEGTKDMTERLADTGLSDAEISAYMSDMENGKVLVLLDSDAAPDEALAAGSNDPDMITTREAKRLKNQDPSYETSMSQAAAYEGTAGTESAESETVSVSDFEDRQPVSDPNADPVSSDTKEALEAAKSIDNTDEVLKNPEMDLKDKDKETVLDSEGNPSVPDPQLKNRINTDHL